LFEAAISTGKVRHKPERLSAFCGKIDLVEVEENLHAFERICAGGNGAGPIGKLDMASRFRWLTATRSTVLQSSKVHPGFCDDPGKRLTGCISNWYFNENKKMICRTQIVNLYCFDLFHHSKIFNYANAVSKQDPI
jgi:hypothetical protein